MRQIVKVIYKICIKTLEYNPIWFKFFITAALVSIDLTMYTNSSIHSITHQFRQKRLYKKFVYLITFNF